jgi:hypothetical protein
MGYIDLFWAGIVLAFGSKTRSTSKPLRFLGNLHDALEAGGYTGHDLEQFLVPVLFCLFAEDTGIFDRESFRLYIENRTAADGSDLGLHLARLFEILNTAPEKRKKNLDETLAGFPYVNGELFNEHLGFADFNADMRNALLACCQNDWSRISPAIFGSLFQSITQPKAFLSPLSVFRPLVCVFASLIVASATLRLCAEFRPDGSGLQNWLLPGGGVVFNQRL